MSDRRRLLLTAVICLLVFVILPPLGFADGNASGGYLSEYKTSGPQPTQMSWLSTLAYLLSLLVVFGFVVVAAYFVSKFMSQRFGRASAAHGGKMLAHLPLGPNLSVCVVELAGRVMMLGVTEHSISYLAEITDPEEIARLSLSSDDTSLSTMDGLFGKQMGSLEQIARSLPSVFRNHK